VDHEDRVMEIERKVGEYAWRRGGSNYEMLGSREYMRNAIPDHEE
jgi:hypothetical protein